MHPMFAALALHSQTVSLLAHHPHKHTAGFYANQAAGHFSSAFKALGPHAIWIAVGAIAFGVVMTRVTGRFRRNSN
jgi:hypothetical protein